MVYSKHPQGFEGQCGPFKILNMKVSMVYFKTFSKVSGVSVTAFPDPNMKAIELLLQEVQIVVKRLSSH